MKINCCNISRCHIDLKMCRWQWINEKRKSMSYQHHFIIRTCAPQLLLLGWRKVTGLHFDFIKVTWLSSPSDSPRDWLKMQCTWGQRSGKQNLEIMILKIESVPLVLPCSLRSVTTRSYCTLQGKLWGLAQEGSCSRIHHWRGWEKLIPTNSQSGQIQFFQEDPSNTHEVLAFHAPVVSPDNHLGEKKDGDWVWFRNTNDGCCWESTVGFFSFDKLLSHTVI